MKSLSVIRSLLNKACLSFSLSALATSLSASSGTLVVNSFTSGAEASQWKFDNGAEFPGARGAFVVTSGAEGSNSYGELRYDFTPPSPLPANFKPRYVQAIRLLTPGEQGTYRSRVRFRYQMSRPDLVLNLRWVDASGQTLQRFVVPKPSLELTNDSLQSVTLDITSASTFWGGQNNGVTRFPIKSLSVICDAAGRRDTGWIRLDDVEMIPHAQEAAIPFNVTADLLDWRFLNGAEFPGARGGVIHAASDSNSYAQLNYDFTLPANWTGSFCPTYVEARRAVPATASGVRFRLSASTADMSVRVRFVDASGQTFQSEVIKRGKAPGGGQWLDISYPFVPTAIRWGGAADGVVRFPVKNVSIVLDAAGKRDAGYLRIDEFVVVHEPVMKVPVGSGTLITPRWTTGTLAERAGVSINFTSDNQAMDAIKNAGFRWVRKDAFWEHVERSVGSYNFSTFDALVNAAESRGLSTLLIVNYGNPLYTGSVGTPPRTETALMGFQNYCEALARRYAGRNVTFEIWNEPDVPLFWGNAPSAEEYARLLKRGLIGLRRGNPQAKAITGGLSAVYSVTYKFYDDLVASGAMAGANGVGVHLYGCPHPEAQWNNVLTLKAMAAQNTGGDLWCSEWGFSSTDMSPARNGHDEAGRRIQANMTVRQLIFGWWANLPMVTLYKIRDTGSDPRNADQNYGLLASDYTEKPSMKAVKKLLAVAKGRSLAGLMKPSTLPTGMHMARLDGASDKVYVVWLDEGTHDALATIADTRATAVDMYGNALSLVKSGAELCIPVAAGRGPIYITLPGR